MSSFTCQLCGHDIPMPYTPRENDCPAGGDAPHQSNGTERENRTALSVSQCDDATESVRAVDRGFVRDLPGFTSGGHPIVVHLLDCEDTSPVFVGYVDGRNVQRPNECGWCYLNASHTVAAHEAQIG